MNDGIKVRIIGAHPWTGFTGVLVSTSKPLSCLPEMGRVVLDSDQETHGVMECFARAENLVAVVPGTKADFLKAK